MVASLSSSLPSIVLSPFSDQSRTLNPLLSRTQFNSSNPHKPVLRGSVFVARLGFKPGLFPDPADWAAEPIRDLFVRAESVLYTIADAAVANSDTVTETTAKQNNDWLSGIANYMEYILKVLKDGLSALHVPYSYGFAIILLTVLVKAATFPLTRKQVESSMAMRSLQPQIKAIQQRYAGNQEKIQLETARLYKVAGINPFAGCLPTLATIPVWIGLYRALSNVANEGLLTEGFFWIPSLAGPTTVAARQSGSGISWLFPFVDGHPPLGWSDTFAYLVLPLLLVISQYISVQIMQSSQATDPNTNNSQSQVITKILPLMIGYFSLSVPSGLSLYWLTNNILSTAQQVWLQKLGGAKNPVSQEEESRILKSISELNSTKNQAVNVEISPKPKSLQVEKSTPEGKRPGDRFKQLKEQEAKRKAEKKKLEEAARARTETSTSNPISMPEPENGASTSPVRVLNGDLSSQKKGEILSFEASDKDEEQQLSENRQRDGTKEHESMTAKDNQLPEEVEW